MITLEEGDDASPGSFELVLSETAPRGGLVVGSGIEAAMQDADQAVGELPEGGMVADLAAAELVRSRRGRRVRR